MNFYSRFDLCCMLTAKGPDCGIIPFLNLVQRQFCVNLCEFRQRDLANNIKWINCI